MNFLKRLASVPDCQIVGYNGAHKGINIIFLLETQDESLKEKIRNTCLEKYGTEYYFQSNEYRKDLSAYLEKQRQYALPLEENENIDKNIDNLWNFLSSKVGKE